jgi:ribosomal protein S18 acetylase RimI-like enzyme
VLPSGASDAGQVMGVKPQMEIVRATERHLEGVARLFDLYRQFYECDADIELATRFISARIKNGDSVIFAALEDDEAVGFVQIYRSFCSVEAIRIFILYDLYVDAGHRQSGIGEHLMNRATELAREEGVSRIDLLTAFDNLAGQHLYEKLGYKRDGENFYPYSLKV